MRAQANFFDLARALIGEVSFHHVLQKNMSIEKELMIGYWSVCVRDVPGNVLRRA